MRELVLGILICSLMLSALQYLKWAITDKQRAYIWSHFVIHMILLWLFYTIILSTIIWMIHIMFNI